MATFLLIVVAIIAYFAGSMNGSIAASRFIYKKDIRQYGSGNAGLTNFYRTFGVVGLALVIVIDVAKSVLAILIGGWLMSIVGEATVGRIFAGFCLMLGHCYPAFDQFRGGKGALCGLVLTFMTDWRIGLIVTIIALLIIIFTRWVSLASMAGAVAYPLLVWIFGLGGIEGVVALFGALLLIFRHRENIVRLIQGKEPKLDFHPRPEKKIEDDEF